MTKTFLLLLCVSAACLSTAAGPAQAQIAAPGGRPLTLADATSAALTVSPVARAAGQQLAQAQARLAQAEAGRRLAITFNTTVGGSASKSNTPPPDNQTFGTLQNILTVPVPLGKRPQLFVAQAQAQLLAARATYAGARLALTGQVSAAYFDLLRKQALMQIARDTQIVDQRQLDATRRRNAAGDVPDLDVLRAQVPLASAQASVAGAEAAVTVAAQALNALTGRGLDSPLAVADVPPSATLFSYTLEQARGLAAKSSADVQAAEATVRADEIALENARRFSDPTLAFQVSDTRTNDQTSFRRLDTVQASVTFPLTDGGLGRGQVREAEATLAQARAQLEVVRLTALTAVSTAFLTAQATRQQVAAAKVAQDIARVTYDKTLFGYQNGLFPFSDVLTALSALTQARVAYTQAVYDTAVAVAGLTSTVRGFVAPAAPGSAPGPTAPGVSPDVPATSAPGSAKTGTGAAGSGTGGATPNNSPAPIPPTGTNPTGKGTP